MANDKHWENPSKCSFKIFIKNESKWGKTSIIIWQNLRIYPQLLMKDDSVKFRNWNIDESTICEKNTQIMLIGQLTGLIKALSISERVFFIYQKHGNIA